jgi:hypothetical protein
MLRRGGVAGLTIAVLVAATVRPAGAPPRAGKGYGRGAEIKIPETRPWDFKPYEPIRIPEPLQPRPLPGGVIKPEAVDDLVNRWSEPRTERLLAELPAFTPLLGVAVEVVLQLNPEWEPGEPINLPARRPPPLPALDAAVTLETRLPRARAAERIDTLKEVVARGASIQPVSHGVWAIRDGERRIGVVEIGTGGVWVTWSDGRGEQSLALSEVPPFLASKVLAGREPMLPGIWTPLVTRVVSAPNKTAEEVTLRVDGWRVQMSWRDGAGASVTSVPRWLGAALHPVPAPSNRPPPSCAHTEDFAPCPEAPAEGYCLQSKCQRATYKGADLICWQKPNGSRCDGDRRCLAGTCAEVSPHLRFK